MMNTEYIIPKYMLNDFVTGKYGQWVTTDKGWLI